ncbi:two-component system, NarL family, nitrate/nitrite sensor histidine kinase NarX [Bacillus sp. cl95]|nr:two-component system, NarL family, nitrate/nitrite sensor histidine kinase NarX [Bacillus sp. UNCCL13]SFQ87561.1 two-component system, NarL family, nitrate/nitrite sensor histidine kinase NarX [Bacillus sp. cl95]
MSYRSLKIFTILIPTILIGGFEFLRHSVLLHNLSMDVGNYFITILTFIVSFAFSTWMFKVIEEKNQRIAAERELRAIYEERERLAKELHDNIAQTLFLLNVHLKKGKITEAQGLVNSIDTHVRQAIHNLRVKPEEAVSFSSKTEKWLNDWSVVSGIEVQSTIRVNEGYFTPSEEIQIFGIIQEAFMNIRKHSKAEVACLDLTSSSNGWLMVIHDNGIGFTEETVSPQQYGLSMLKERAAKVNASVDISAELGKGTSIRIQGSRNK